MFVGPASTIMSTPWPASFSLLSEEGSWRVGVGDSATSSALVPDHCLFVIRLGLKVAKLGVVLLPSSSNPDFVFSSISLHRRAGDANDSTTLSSRINQLVSPLLPL